MSFIGEIQIFCGSFEPSGWAFCDGRAVGIDANPALYSLIGTTYGGDGVTTFNLPNLTMAVAIGLGTGPGLSPRVLGQAGGEANVTLTAANLPSHNHLLSGTQTAPVTPNNGNLAGGLVYAPYNSSMAQVPLSPLTVTSSGGSAAHLNQQPFLALNYIICLEGIFPS